jgi:GNAT superfamily N-acetyltransferase
LIVSDESATNLKLMRTPLDAPVAQSLIVSLNWELELLYPEDGANHFDLSPQDTASGVGAFLVAYTGRLPVWCGAIRCIGSARMEVKRMYVVQEFRGKGVGTRLLKALEQEALRMGAQSVVLEAGERQQDAIAFYNKLGYSRTPCFGEYAESPLSVCFGKRIA